MQFRIIIFIIITLFSGYNLKSQNLIVYENTKAESYLVKYIVNPDADQTITNYFIQEIAKSIPKMPSYTQYIYSFKQNSKIIKINPSTYNVIIDINEANCSGDIFFKGFSMNDNILPSYISYNLKIFNENNQLIKNYDFKRVSIKDNNSRIADFEFTDTTSTLISANNNYYIVIENKLFAYDVNAINNFNKKRNLIEEYFSTDQFIASSLATIQTIDLQNLEMINLYDIRLDEVEQELSKLYNKELAQKLKLNIYDPINFMNKIDNLGNQVYNLRFNINQILATLDKLYYERGLVLLKDGAIDKAIYNFKKSIEINYFYSPSHYQIALLDYKNGNFDSSTTRIKDIMTKMYPDYITQNLVIELSHAINEAYLYEGNKLIKSEDYNGALVYLEKGKIFCTTTPGIKCDDQVFTSIATAKYGIFSSYLSVADKAVENNKYELAELYLNMAIKYQQENKTDIINKGDIEIIMNKLLVKYIDNGFSSNDEKNFSQALSYFNKTIELNKLLETPITIPRLDEGISIAKNGIYQGYLLKANELFLNFDYNNAESIVDKAINFQKDNTKEIITASDAENLLSKIKYEWYKILINDGNNYFHTASFDKALNNFKEAKLLESKYNFVKIDSLDKLIRATSKPIILKELETGNFKVFQGDLNGAKELLTSSTFKQAKYNLNNDFDINTNVKTLRDKIFTKECNDAQYEYDKFIDLVKQKVAEKHFIEANNYLENALNIITINATCGILPTIADSIKTVILPALNYQKLFINIDEALKNNNFGLIIDEYIKAEDIFNSFKLEKFGLQHRSLFNYAVSKNNVNFLTYLTDYFTTNKNYKEALALLKELRSRNYPEKNAKLIQENLARLIAEQDRKENPQSNPKINLLAYTDGDKWFKNFSKAYIKKWKSIK